MNNDQLKLYVWTDTDTHAGSAFGGTLFAFGISVEDARARVRLAAIKNPVEITGYDDLDYVPGSDHKTIRQQLECDLARVPNEAQSGAGAAHGGDC